MELKDLKVGDEVFSSGGLGYDYGTILKITKITNTMIICDRKKFRKDSGSLIGNTNHYHFPRIEILTDKLRKQVYRKRIITVIGQFNFDKLDYDKLKEIYKIIKTFK